MINISSVLGWKSLDIAFLELLIEEFELDCFDIREDMEVENYNKCDINDWIYVVHHIAACKFFDKVECLSNENNIEFDREKIEEGIYCNYMDSGYFNGDLIDVDVMTDDSDEMIAFAEKIKNKEM